MTYTVNGQPADLTQGATVRDLVRTLTAKEVGADGRTPDGAALGLAVAVDGAVVPRSRWATTTLEPGAEVEVVEAVQGG
ncbi:sulfur carrier protein ThiS [Granulicoccus sp. GXG6511]|uniref:sulfur carrier protein ThiS n=1 Tax=Granulicoccus sp. GXG6511 TaxID=3381351 RepID=UPI003D7EEB7D